MQNIVAILMNNPVMLTTAVAAVIVVILLVRAIAKKRFFVVVVLLALVGGGVFLFGPWGTGPAAARRLVQRVVATVSGLFGETARDRDSSSRRVTVDEVQRRQDEIEQETAVEPAEAAPLPTEAEQREEYFWRAIDQGNEASLAELRAGEYSASDVRVRDGEPPLTYAIKAGSFSTVQELIRMGADVHAEGASDKTPMRAIAERFQSRSLGSDDRQRAAAYPALRAILSASLEYESFEEVMEYSALLPFISARGSDLATIRRLIEAGCSVEGPHGDHEPMLAAARIIDTPVAELLIEYGAEADVIERWSVRDGFVTNQYWEHAAYIAAYADREWSGQARAYVPTEVADRDETAFIDLLLQNGMDVNRRLNQDHRRLLHIAAGRVDEEQWGPDFLFYLLRLGADPNRQDADGDTAVHTAAYGESVVAVEMLTEAGGSIYRRNEAGEAPLNLVLDSRDFAVSVFETTTLGLRVMDADDPVRMVETLSTPEAQETVDRIISDSERVNRSIEEIGSTLGDALGF